MPAGTTRLFTPETRALVGHHRGRDCSVSSHRAEEARRGQGAIGTTQRGIGPAYYDKTGRNGLRAHLLANPEQLADSLVAHIEAKNEWLATYYHQPTVEAKVEATRYVGYAQRLAPHLVDGSVYLDRLLGQGRRVLAEGAQGTLLDLDHGTYPFVTSSSPTAGGALTGLGVGPKMVGRVLGVAKAFTSRVGSGPFPTELAGEMALRLRGTGANPWDEYGTTTGRPRRVGWLDLVILAHARRVNGLTELALTKLDILSGLAEIPVCVAYELDGERIDYFPVDIEALGRIRPVYQTLSGWTEDVTHARKLSDLPPGARAYVDFIAEQVGVPIQLISVGPGRDQIIR